MTKRKWAKTDEDLEALLANELDDPPRQKSQPLVGIEIYPIVTDDHAQNAL